MVSNLIQNISVVPLEKKLGKFKTYAFAKKKLNNWQKKNWWSSLVPALPVNDTLSRFSGKMSLTRVIF